MKISEALELVSKNYVPGVVAFYGKTQPDLWQEAHDVLEQAMLTKDLSIMEAAAGVFAHRCLGLIQKYSQFNSPTKIQAQDAFVIGDPQKVLEQQSLEDDFCVICESKERLMPQIDPEDFTRVFLICIECKNKRCL